MKATRLDFYSQFLKSDPEKSLDRFQNGTDPYWKKQSQNLSFNLFQEMATRVPAYKEFLKKNRIKKEKIKSYTDLKNVPPIDKPTYIDAYSLNQLCWDGKLDTSYMLSASSGSTGQPYYWPRSDEQTLHGAMISELIYRECFRMHESSTLFIISFGMGMWIAGTYTMMITQWLAQKGMPVTVATPGINKKEILRLVLMGKKHYDQIVLVGLPPFVKDVIDTGSKEGINWKTIKIKFLLTGEAFTERWRDHLKEKMGFNVFTDAINLYGSADVGLMASETPTTVFLRRLAAENSEFCNALFQTERVPSVHQYNPHLRHFESLNGELLISSRCMVPLVRYNTKDVGDVLYHSEASKRLKKLGIDICQGFQQNRPSRFLWTLPIVYLFGRGKFSATIYGITLFPEFIKFVLDNAELEPSLTGKFVIATEENKDLAQTLHLRVELNDGIKKSRDLQATVKRIFIHELPKISSEYTHLLESVKQRAHPIITLHSYGDPSYFPRGVVKKTS